MPPLSSRAHDLKLDSIIHSETQRGKSLTDAHFTLAMMYINRCCSETGDDVFTPGNIVFALNSFGGVSNCTAEMVYINIRHKDSRLGLKPKKAEIFSV